MISIKTLLRKCKTAYHFFLNPLKKYYKDANFRRTVDYARMYQKLKVNDNIIFYESFHGKNMVDSPYAIFKYLLEHPNYKNYLHVWALNSLDHCHDKTYLNHPRVKFVKVHSKEYIRYLNEAKYLINNTTFPSYFQKKDEQIYINTWHGTPLKTLGKDMKGELGQHKNIQRNFLQSDYILHPNKYTADIISESHDLNGIYTGKIIVEGYPRIDLTINADKEKVLEKLKQLIHIDKNEKIVLYAPTWRGEVNNVKNIKDEIIDIINNMYHYMPQGHKLILKVHTLVYKFIKDDEILKNICIPDWFDTNELMSVVDILITDYSSIFFDYLVTDKPIIFFVYDKEKYSKERGFYLDFNELPGPICLTVNEVIEQINNIQHVMENYKSLYTLSKNKYCYMDDGHATSRIVNIIFHGKEENRNVYQVLDENKINILMYCGGFLNNGITSSVINLLNHVDYSKYNVAVIDKGVYDETSAANFMKLNPKVKKIYRVGSMNTTIKEIYYHNWILKKGLVNKKNEKYLPKNLYQKELKRIFGNTKFDIVVDFSGYVPFWTLLFAFGDFKKKCIYQHNDMRAEYGKKINGKYKHRQNLNIIFPLYKHFDKIVAVGGYTKEVNVENLNQYIDPSKAVVVHNTIDYQKIFQLANEGEYVHVNDQLYLITNRHEENGLLKFESVPVPNKNFINFVTIGRLSPEKDHKKLILAFNKLLEERNDVKLYIIGEGVLEKELKDLVKKLNLNEFVIFTGQLKNPFVIINQCDCFVLSSNHEGQPMVLLEALILNKPIIATDIPGNRSVLQDQYGELVPNTIEGLLYGFHRFLNNEIKKEPFHYQKYNEEALNMFYTEVGSI